MDRRGQVTAYAGAQRAPQRSRRTVILAAVMCAVVVLVLVNAAKVDDVVAGGRQAVGRLQKEMMNKDMMARPFSHLHNPFKQQAHPPPLQDNSTLGETRWFSDWKWLNPFSSTVTLDEDRALLPPVAPRPPVYTYYEPRDDKAEGPLRAAEEKLLEVWRRAWWAQGFKPVVLGPLDAMENPLYQKVHTVNTTAGVQMELMRFLAWSHMGDGILANWLVLPMAGYYNPLLVYLREARYSTLTMYVDLGMGLFAGPKVDLDKAISFFLSQPRIQSDESLLDLISAQEELFHIETRRKGVAFYNDKAIREKYRDVADAVAQSAANGYRMLADLITAHLHTTFLRQYTEGLAIVAPYGQSATLIPHRALTLAHALNTCPSEPRASEELKEVPISSCPPNVQDCTNCKPVAVNFPAAAPNSTDVFTIGTVAHTYTMSRLLAPHAPDFNFTVPYIRRNTSRDRFVNAVSEEITPKGQSGYARIVTFKETVAQPGKGAMRSLWRPAEADWAWDALEWRLGFALSRPAEPGVSDASGAPVPQQAIGNLDMPAASAQNKIPEVLQPLLVALGDAKAPHAEDLTLQAAIVKQTGEELANKRWLPHRGPDMRKVCEAWNLADAEAWRFVRAMTAREEIERRKWMEEEKKFKP